MNEVEKYLDRIGIEPELKKKAFDLDALFEEYDDDSMRIPDNYPVQCYECDWKGTIGECPVEKESEGWEYPSYYVSVCPECGQGIEL